jgi:Biotin-lipoyl like
MNSPYRVHPALPSKAEVNKTIPFPRATQPLAGKPPLAPPHPSPNEGGPGRLGLLLKLEGDMRQLPNRQALAYHAVNESRPLLGHAQAYFFRLNRRDRFVLETVSDIAQPDLRAPFVSALTSVINRLTEPSKQITFDLHQMLKSDSHPHPQGLWLPLPDAKGKAFGGLLFLRNDLWVDDVVKIAERLVGAYAFAMRALTPPALLRGLALPSWALYGLPLLTAALAFVPVPLTTLAPFEVVPLDPTPVTAPIDGVISSIAVDPNTRVAVGQQLFTFDATNQKAAMSVAQQNVMVAEAKLGTARNGAFADQDLKRSVAVTEQELELSKAELVNAEDQMRRTSVAASAAGVIVYASRSELLGKPVRVGERVMDIADPTQVAYRIELGVHDSIALGQGAGVRLFLDADPLNPREAMIIEESYHAVQTKSGPMAFIVKAKPSGEDAPVRMGLRGTAQLSGKWVSLGFYLFRRPVSALRQHFGI